MGCLSKASSHAPVLKAITREPVRAELSRAPFSLAFLPKGINGVQKVNARAA